MKYLPVLPVAGALALAAGMAQAQRPFELDDLFKLERAGAAEISPDGSQVAVVSQRWTEKAYWNTANTLWIVPVRGGNLRRVSEDAAELSQTKPVWSPDGRQLAYIATEEKGAKLKVVRVDGRQPASTLPACDEKETIGTIAWNPAGTHLAVMCEKPEEQKPEKPAVIVATQSDYYRGKVTAMSERRVVLFDLAERTGRELAKNGTFLTSDGALLWSSPQTLLAVATPDKDYGGFEFLDGRVIHRIDIPSGKIAALPEMPGSRMPALSPDGRELMFADGGTVGVLKDWRQTWRLEALELKRFGADGTAMSVTPPMDIYVNRDSRQKWVAAPDGRAGGMYYMGWLDRANGRVKRYSPATGEWQDITPAGTDVESFSISADGRKMAVVQGDANTPAEAYVFDLQRPSAKPVRLTRFEDAIRRHYAVAPIEPLKWRSKDNRFDIGGWLVKPANYVPGKRYPLIVDVHGGPGAAFRNSFDLLHFEGAHQVAPELYAAKGYMVLMVNPRGDPGYGRAHQEALLEGWAYATRYDIFAGLDEAIRLGYADPDRLGIAGASYGGWVTAFAVTQTNRFKAASANDPVIDSNVSSAVAYRGERATNYWMQAGFAGGLLFDKPFETSDPRTVQTPILLRFGLREEYPFPSQFFVSGLPYFAYLDTHCRPVEMIMHPEEGHGIFTWSTLRDYITRDLAWFDYWIEGKGEAPIQVKSCPQQPS